MVKIKPFKAVVLNPELERETGKGGKGSRAEMVCPVYDTIDAALYEKYSAKKNNVICFTTRKEGVEEREFVAAAKQNLNRFFRERLLVEREKPAFYIYGVRYSLSGEVLEQIPEEDRREIYFALGLVALVKTERLNEGEIFGHEKTFEAKTRERCRLMKACDLHFSPIVAAYKMSSHDHEGEGKSEMSRIFENYLRRDPIVDVELDGARHLLWEISDTEIVGRIQSLMKGEKIIILDGHHRYAASSRLGTAAYALTMLLDGRDEGKGLLLLPWHRCVKVGESRMQDLWSRVEANFCVERVEKVESYERSKWCESKWCESKWCESESENENESEKDENEFRVRLGMYDGDNFFLLRVDERKIRALAEERGERVGLDLISLHEWVLGPDSVPDPTVSEIAFVASPREAVRKVDAGECRVAFFLKPLRIAEVEHKAREERKAFPQKSTLFLPKVAEGVVMCRVLPTPLISFNHD